MRAIAAVLLTALCASAETAGEILARDAKAFEAWKTAPVTLTGRVVDEDGFGVAAEISLQGRKAAADRRGWFRIEALARRNALIRVAAEGCFVEFRVADLALPAGQDAADAGTIRLRARRDGRVRMVFGGDAMMGRRFLRPDTIESPPAPPLRPGSLAADAAAVLADVAPVLREADLAVLNLESVVADAPGDPVSRKEHNFLTPPAALDAFADAGVDAFTLGNNHSWDFGEAGLKRTLEELGKRRILACGAGIDEAAARRPAELGAGASKFRLLSYSGVPGPDVPLFAAGERGGAAQMGLETILGDVLAAADAAPVIVALHTGTEYSSRPTRRAREAAAVAVEGGAALVVGHHAHAPQGLALVEGVLVARCLGNFVFDQSRYEALPGLLLVADFEDGRVAAARLVPILNDDYRVRAAAGPVARWTARRVGALSEGVEVAWRAGGVEAALEPGDRAPSERTVILSGGLPARVAPEDPAAFVVAARCGAPLEAGRDLLRVGGFEDGDADGEALEPGPWAPGAGARISVDGPRSGAACLRLACAPDSSAMMRFRVPVPERFTVAGWWNAPRGATAAVECDICELPSLEPVATAVAGRLASEGPGWKAFSFDLVRPPRARFVRIRLRASAPGDSAADVAFDDLAVIEWEPVRGRREAPNEWDWLRSPGGAGTAAATLELERIGRD